MVHVQKTRARRVQEANWVWRPRKSVNINLSSVLGQSKTLYPGYTNVITLLFILCNYRRRRWLLACNVQRHQAVFLLLKAHGNLVLQRTILLILLHYFSGFLRLHGKLLSTSDCHHSVHQARKTMYSPSSPNSS